MLLFDCLAQNDYGKKTDSCIVQSYSDEGAGENGDYEGHFSSDSGHKCPSFSSGYCEDALCFAVSSMTCYQIRDGMNISAAVKERYPDMPIIWGGYHPSTQPEQTLQDPNIDIVVIGQGELTFIQQNFL